MQMRRRKWAFGLMGLFLVGCITVLSTEAQATGFTNEDRERLIRLETTLEMFMKQFTQRLEDLRAEMNQRFEQVDKRFEQVDKRFEQVDKRFEEVHKRFEQLTSFLWMLVGIFTTLVVAVIGFAWWDRRTTIRQAREETIEALGQRGIDIRLVQALRDFAEEEPRMAKAMRACGLL